MIYILEKICFPFSVCRRQVILTACRHLICQNNPLVSEEFADFSTCLNTCISTPALRQKESAEAQAAYI